MPLATPYLMHKVYSVTLVLTGVDTQKEVEHVKFSMSAGSTMLRRYELFSETQKPMGGPDMFDISIRRLQDLLLPIAALPVHYLTDTLKLVAQKKKAKENPLWPFPKALPEKVPGLMLVYAGNDGSPQGKYDLTQEVSGGQMVYEVSRVGHSGKRRFVYCPPDMHFLSYTAKSGNQNNVVLWMPASSSVELMYLVEGARQVYGLHLANTIKAVALKKNVYEIAHHIYTPESIKQIQPEKPTMTPHPIKNLSPSALQAFKPAIIPMDSNVIVLVDGDEVKLSLLTPTVDAAVSVVQPVTMMEMEKDDPASMIPCMRLPLSLARDMMRLMWDQGIRPTGYSNDEPEDMVPILAMEKLEAHLSDMRNIAMAFINNTVDLKK